MKDFNLFLNDNTSLLNIHHNSQQSRIWLSDCVPICVYFF